MGLNRRSDEQQRFFKSIEHDAASSQGLSCRVGRAPARPTVGERWASLALDPPYAITKLSDKACIADSPRASVWLPPAASASVCPRRANPALACRGWGDLGGARREWA